MNNLENKAVSERKKRLNGKIKDLLIIGGLAILIVFAAWKIFYQEERIDGQTSVSTLSESEEKVSRLLEEIDGVGEAEVMICETEEGVEGVVVVCEGAKNLQVVMDIREAVAAALGTKQNAVKIYLKKE